MMGDMDKYEQRRQRLIQIRDEMCGGRAVNVARKIDREPNYISRMLYPEGKKGGKRIADDMVEIIETAFNLPRGWMDGIADENEPNVSFGSVHTPKGRYPVLSWVSAGDWAEAIEPYHRKSIDRWYETTTECSEQSFWLDVKGDSMTSHAGLSIPEGTAILVDPEVEPRNGKLVVAKLDNDNEATFKQLVIDAGRKYLKPLNPRYATIEINGNCRIIGVVVDAKITNIP